MNEHPSAGAFILQVIIYVIVVALTILFFDKVGVLTIHYPIGF